MRRREEKRLPSRKDRNHANCGVAKGKRLFVAGTVNQVKKLIGKLALKIQASGFSGIVEIIHSDNRGEIFTLLRENNIPLRYSPYLFRN
jgi:hypothetical protein